jgi:amino acid transporter
VSEDKSYPNRTDVAESAAMQADKKLKRELSFWDLLFLSMGGIIGSGWLLAVNGAAAAAGPGVIFSWIIGGILLIFVALTFAEVSGMLPRSGAIVRYPHYSHGSYTGFILGWAYLLTAVTVPTIEAEAVVTYASTYVPSLVTSSGVLSIPEGVVAAFLLMLFFFFLNYFGIKVLGKTNTGVTVWKFVIPTLTFLLLFAVFNSSNFTSYGGLFPEGISPVFLAIPTTGIVFSYLGFRQALEYGGEAKNPQKDVPRATILSVVLAILIYSLLQLAFIGGINWGKISLVNSAGQITGPITPGDWSGLASSTWTSAPFYKALTSSSLAALAAFGVVLLIDAYVSPSGTGWIYTGTSTRTLYGLATDGYLHKGFLKINEKTGIPYISLIAAFIIGLIFLAPFPSWYSLVGFISSGTVFTYITGGIALQVFRRTAPTLHRPYRLTAAPIIAPIAFIAASLIVYWSGFTILFYVFTATLAGIPLYYIFYAPKGLGISRGTGAALGILFWIVLIAISYFGYTNLISYYNVNHTSLGLTASQASVLNTSFLEYFAGLVALSVVFTALIQTMAKPETRVQVKSGWWLILYALVIMAISFYGAFGLDVVNGSTPIGFPWDTVAMVVVSVVFFYFAVSSGYKTEDIEHILSTQGIKGQTGE